MAIFGRGYDRDYDAGFRQSSDTGYRGSWGRPAGGWTGEGQWNRGNQGEFGGGASPRDFNRYDTGMQQPRYDRGFRGGWANQGRGEVGDRGGAPYPMEGGNFQRYDRDFDFGRPRYDRTFRGGNPNFGGGQPGFDGYDRTFRGRNPNFGGDQAGFRGYDRTFRGNDRSFRESHFPMGYVPYSVREGYDSGYSGRNFVSRDHPWY